ncbi:MAG: RidA family protein [Bacteroidetes bacterium]|nr:RidA family protein [Bacteroidota bacterium]
MKHERSSLATGTPWERAYGYRRAVRVGPLVFVAGTTGTDDGGQVMAPDDAAAQARRSFERIEQALAGLGASLADVVRTRMFVTDITRDGDAVGRVHGEVFGTMLHPPAATMVEVRALIDPAMRVEIEAEAMVPEGDR